jgi:hypothetical protein
MTAQALVSPRRTLTQGAGASAGSAEPVVMTGVDGQPLQSNWTCVEHRRWLTFEQIGECFWSISEHAAVQWPRVLIPRCEKMFAVTPYAAEFFSTVTALVFVVLGLMQLLSSGYSDEVIDLAASVFVINGVSAMMSHGTQQRFWGQMDSITINVMALFFCYAVMQAYFPSLNRRKIVRTLLLLSQMSLMVVCMVWNGHSVPDPHVWRWHDYLIVIIGSAVLAFATAITYSKSKVLAVDRAQEAPAPEALFLSHRLFLHPGCTTVLTAFLHTCMLLRFTPRALMHPIALSLLSALAFSVAFRKGEAHAPPRFLLHLPRHPCLGNRALFAPVRRRPHAPFSSPLLARLRRARA